MTRRLSQVAPWLILAVAVAVRLVSLSFPFGDFDEGVYLATVRSVVHGAPLISQTFNSQGPLFIRLAAVFYRVSPTIVSMRLLSVLASLVVIGLTFRIIDRWIGRGPALFAAAYLTVDPLFVTVSRTFQADLPWLAATMASFNYLLIFNDSRRPRDVWLSAVFFAVSVLIKLNLLFVPVILAYFVWRWLKDGWRALGYLGCYVATTVIGVLLLVPWRDFGQFYHDAIAIRTIHLGLGATTFTRSTWRLFLQHEGALLFIAILVLLLWWRPKRDVSLLQRLAIVWLVSTLLGVRLYNPLFAHHLVFVIAPLVLVGALAFQQAWQNVPRLVTLAVVVGIFAVSLMTSASLRSILEPTMSNYDRTLAATAATIRTQTKPNDLVITDDPLLLYFVDRPTPPNLVDTSFVRIQAGQLTAAELITTTQNTKPAAVVFISGRFNLLPRYRQWLDQHYHHAAASYSTTLFLR